MPASITTHYRAPALASRRRPTAVLRILAAIITVYIVWACSTRVIHPVTISCRPCRPRHRRAARPADRRAILTSCIIGSCVIGIVQKNAIMNGSIRPRRRAATRQGRAGGDPPRACLLRFRPIMMTKRVAALSVRSAADGRKQRHRSEMRHTGPHPVGGLIVSQVLTLSPRP